MTDSPTLEVGFAIDTSTSYDELLRLQSTMDSVEARVSAEAAKIERSTSGMVNLAGANAQMTSFGNAATQAGATSAAAMARAEKAGEALSRQMDRQIQTFGMSRTAAAALKAEQNGLSELADRLRSQEASLTAMRQKATAALQAETVATRAFGSSGAVSMAAGTTAAAGLSAGVAGLGRSAEGTKIEILELSHIARNMTEQLAMGVNPMRALTMESGRLLTSLQYSGGSISGLTAQFASMLGIIKVVQNAELAEAASSAGAQAAAIAGVAARIKETMAAGEVEIELALAAQRVATTSVEEAVASARLTAAHEAQTIAATQLAIAEDALAVAQGRAAETGAASAAATRTVIGGTGIGLIGIATVAGIAFGAIKQLQSQIKDDGTLTRYRDSLGLTHKEMLQLSDGVEKAGGKIKELGDVTVTFGDVMHGVWQEISREASSGGAWESFKGGASTAFNAILDAWDKTSAALTAGLWTIADIAKDVFNYVGQAIGQGFYNGVNKAIDAINYLASHAPGMPGITMNIIPHVEGGKPIKDLVKTIQKQADDNYAAALAQNHRAYAGIKNAAEQSARDRMKAEADALKADRTPKKDRKQGDHGLAEALAQLDAQIKGQLALAAAYQVSDAAAIKAEALQKAEQAAIKHKSETGIFYEKELALAVAQRAADGGKVIADIHAEAAARSVVNDLVEQGIIPVQRMGQALEEQTKKRQLMAALAVAEDKGWLKQAADLRAEIANLSFAQGVLNEQLATEASLRQVASNNDRLDQIKLETQLIGASNEVRAVRLAQLEAEHFIRDNAITDPQQKSDVTKSYVDAAAAAANLTTAQDNYNKSLSYTADLMGAINDQAQATAGNLSDAFGNVGAGIGKALTALTGYAATQAKLDQEHKAALKAAGADTAAAAKIDILYAKQSATVREQATMQAIAGIKSLFKEHSTAYKVMSAVEKAYAAWKAAQAIIDMARDIQQTISSIANSSARATAAGAEGIAHQSKLPFPYNIAAMAATAVALIAAGIAVFGGGGGGGAVVAPPTSDDLQKAAGTGTVLGSPKDQSASIAHSLDLVAKNTNEDLQYSNQMLIALRSIDTSIGAMAATVAKQINVAGSLFDTTNLKIGTSGSSGFLGLFSSSTTRSLYDAGITLAATTVGNIVASGIAGQTYQVVEQIKKSSGFLGIGGGTKTTYSTTTGALPADVTGAIQSVIGALENGLVTAANLIGIDGAKAMLDGFQVNIGKISFNGLDAQGIEDELNAIFSSVGDKMAQALFPALASMQKVGEGLFETFVRVAKEYETVDVELKSLGRSFGAVGVGSIAARDALVQLFGGLDNFVSATDTFRDKFLSDAEQMAPIQASVVAELQRLGLSSVTTRDQFKNVVLGLDLTTDAGRQMYASLLAVAPAFDKVISYFDSTNKTLADSLKSTVDQFNGFVVSLTKYRATLFDTTAAQDAAYAVLRKRFMDTAALAATGDATALGGLQDSAKSFLDNSLSNASTLLQYQRDVALVARGVDQGIFAAESTADYAQLQLDAMKNANGILQQISANTAATTAALTQPVVTTTSTPATPIVTGPDAPATQADIQALSDSINAGLETIAEYTGTTASALKTVTRDGYVTVASDKDAPVYTSAIP